MKEIYWPKFRPIYVNLFQAVITGFFPISVRNTPRFDRNITFHSEEIVDTGATITPVYHIVTKRLFVSF